MDGLFKVMQVLIWHLDGTPIDLLFLDLHRDQKKVDDAPNTQNAVSYHHCTKTYDFFLMLENSYLGHSPKKEK
jgi:hypothetical protein